MFRRGSLILCAPKKVKKKPSVFNVKAMLAEAQKCAAVGTQSPPLPRPSTDAAAALEHKSDGTDSTPREAKVDPFTLSHVDVIGPKFWSQPAAQAILRAK